MPMLRQMLATVAFLQASMIGLRGVTSDIKIRMVNPITDRTVVPGKHISTSAVTGINQIGTKRVSYDQTGTQVTRSHNSKRVSVMRSVSHTAHKSQYNSNNINSH